jgi:hypothetical protein
MRKFSSVLLAVLLSILPQGARAAESAGEKLAVVNKVRFYPAQGHEKDMVGGRFYGSNVSTKEGFELLGEIKDVPAAGTWTELTLPNTTVYRWVKYVAPAGSHGRVAKLAFCDGTRRLMGQGFGSFPDGWRRVLDASEPAPRVFFQNEAADGAYIGLDLGEAATGPWPQLQPGGGREFPGPVTVTIMSKNQGVIRYTMDGTVPTAESEVYSAPIKVDKTSTISAVLFRDGKAPTRSADATYIIGHGIDHPTFHTGNSLTGITGRYPLQEFSAGYRNDRKSYGLGGGLTKALWNAAFLPIGDRSNMDQWIDLYSTRVGQTVQYRTEEIQKTITEWKALWPTVTKIEDYTIQPRDFDIAEEADYDNRFLNLVFQKAPDAQPWLYIEWTEQNRQRPTDLGKEPTTEMTKVWPAGTWEESMAAMILYGEDLKRKVNETYKGTKPLRIIPAAIAVGWIHHMIENGEVPGIGKDEFYPALFSDQVHLNMNGAYLVDCTWYAAFHKESPEGKFLPLGTTVSAPEARIMQRLAWDVVKNYPDSGVYEEGTTPCGEPKIVAAGAPEKGMMPVGLSSSTPGAWFRYTMDGTTPTRTRGYVYCGAISARAGMTIKAIAYESGMADSPVTSANF